MFVTVEAKMAPLKATKGSKSDSNDKKFTYEDSRKGVGGRKSNLEIHSWTRFFPEKSIQFFQEI